MAAEPQSKIVLRASMLSDVGVVRDHNEDAAYVDPEERFFIVADGMGGHAAGEIASAMTVDTVRAALERADAEVRQFAENPTDAGRKGLASLLEQAVRDAHAEVYDRGIREPDKQGMGTTCDVVLLAGQEAFIAHVGDSRTFLFRAGKMAQITTDHTVAEVLLLEGKLSPEEAQVSPLRTILVNAIGVAEDVGVEMAHIRLQPGDQLLLSSDGLHDYFPTEEELGSQLAGKPDEILGRLVETAKERGGHDNISGVNVQILDILEEAAAAVGEAELGGEGDRDAVPEPMGRVDTLPFGQVTLSPGDLEGGEGEARADAATAPVPVEGEAPAPGEAGGAEAAREVTAHGEIASDGGAASGDPSADDATSNDADDEGARVVVAEAKGEERGGATGASDDEGEERESATGASDDEGRSDAAAGGSEGAESGAEEGEADGGVRDSDRAPDGVPADRMIEVADDAASSSDAAGAEAPNGKSRPEAEGAAAAAEGGAAAEAGEGDGETGAPAPQTGEESPGETSANGEGARARAPSPPLVPETKGPGAVPADDDDEGYVEDDTLVGYDPESVKPPAPKAEDSEGSDAGDGDRQDPEAELDS